MNRVQGQSWFQVEFESLENSILAENPVRVIGVLVDKLDLSQLGFVQKVNENVDSEKKRIERDLAEL